VDNLNNLIAFEVKLEQSLFTLSFSYTFYDRMQSLLLRIEVSAVGTYSSSYLKPKILSEGREKTGRHVAKQIPLRKRKGVCT